MSKETDDLWELASCKDNPDFDEVEFMRALSQDLRPTVQQLTRCTEWYKSWLLVNYRDMPWGPKAKETKSLADDSNKA